MNVTDIMILTFFTQAIDSVPILLELMIRRTDKTFEKQILLKI